MLALLRHWFIFKTIVSCNWKKSISVQSFWKSTYICCWGCLLATWMLCTVHHASFLSA